MSQDALGQLKHLKTARARWPFPDGCVVVLRSVRRRRRWGVEDGAYARLLIPTPRFHGVSDRGRRV